MHNSTRKVPKKINRGQVSLIFRTLRKDDFFKAIISYQNRERRFGKTSEQLLNPPSNE